MRRHHRYGKKASGWEDRHRTKENGAAVASHSGATAFSSPSTKPTISKTPLV